MKIMTTLSECRSFGPTIFMICDSESQARDIQEELSKKFTTDPRFLGCRSH